MNMLGIKLLNRATLGDAKAVCLHSDVSRPKTFIDACDMRTSSELVRKQKSSHPAPARVRVRGSWRECRVFTSMLSSPPLWMAKTECTPRSQNRNRRRSGIEIFFVFQEVACHCWRTWRGCRLRGREPNQHTALGLI
jgi:hypothetical protein